METPASFLERLRIPGDAAAWTRFVRLYTPLLASWAAGVGLRESEAADLIQDVFLLLLEKLPRFTCDSKKSFRAWLRTVTLNKYRERFRRAAVPVTAGAEVLAEVADPAEAFWEAEYRQRLVGQAMRLAQPHFAPESWRLFQETVAEGRSAGDVAAERGTTPGAVRVARFRVLARLRQELDGLLE